MLLEVENLVKRFGDKTVVDGLSFTLEKGAIGCLLGPSGCGKTTVLRLIAGFDDLTEGKIRLAGNTVSRPGHTLTPEQRHIGMVFQDYALFPHLNVQDNIGFGLHGLSRVARTERIAEMLILVNLTDAASAFSHRGSAHGRR